MCHMGKSPFLVYRDSKCRQNILQARLLLKHFICFPKLWAFGTYLPFWLFGKLVLRILIHRVSKTTGVNAELLITVSVCPILFVSPIQHMILFICFHGVVYRCSCQNSSSNKVSGRLAALRYCVSNLWWFIILYLTTEQIN